MKQKIHHYHLHFFQQESGAPTTTPTAAKKLDIVILVDASESVFDPSLSNWQNHLDVVSNIITEALTGDVM